jgi:benzoyl-CoA reductase/2-hydroxyglutaryl-CoA dehydratase subunit BcrC/BadD/HgdB
MKSESVEKKYMPEISQKEIEELRSTIQATSRRVIAENIERMKKTDEHRPKAMQYFDEVADFALREKEIQAAKKEGKKVIGYMCLFAPIELVLASGAIPVRVNSGWYDAAKLGDRVVPVEVCPMVRSTIGAKMIALSPYLELSDALISVLTCDDEAWRNLK